MIRLFIFGLLVLSQISFDFYVLSRDALHSDKITSIAGKLCEKEAEYVNSCIKVLGE